MYLTTFDLGMYIVCGASKIDPNLMKLAREIASKCIRSSVEAFYDLVIVCDG